jgi:hypothetical protein
MTNHYEGLEVHLGVGDGSDFDATVNDLQTCDLSQRTLFVVMTHARRSWLEVGDHAVLHLACTPDPHHIIRTLPAITSQYPIAMREPFDQFTLIAPSFIQDCAESTELTKLRVILVEGGDIIIDLADGLDLEIRVWAFTRG